MVEKFLSRSNFALVAFALSALWTACEIPGMGPSPAPSPSPSLGAEELKVKAHAELLQEVFRVVLMRDPKDQAEFATYLDTLGQGASFEGVYNGFTHSSAYREMESSQKGASPEAVKLFASELLQLQKELPERTVFNAASAQPLALLVQPTETSESGVGTVEYGNAPTAAATARAQTPEELAQLFVGSSIFTLKRVLGDEALKVLAAKKSTPEQLTAWYGAFVSRMAGLGVDFGLPLRNKADDAFHRSWAATADFDRLEWEVLNRVHRVLNEANKRK